MTTTEPSTGRVEPRALDSVAARQTPALGNTDPHPLVAMVAFLFSALTAITAFKLTGAPFRWMSLAVGLLSLVALVVGELGDHSLPAKSIGTGGIERWVVYPIVLWLPFFGGHLLAESSKAAHPATNPGSTSDRNPGPRGEEAA